MWSRKRATDRRARDRGVTTVEYGLIIAGVGIAAIAGIFALRNAFTTTFNDTLEGNGVSSCAPSDPNCTAYSALPSPAIPANSALAISGYSPITGQTGTTITTQTPTVTGGSGTRSFTISPALPAGLAISATTGAISGTPSATQATTSHTVTVTDSSGSATTTVSVTITNSTPSPVAFATGYSNVTAETGTAISSQTPTTTGGSGTKTFSVLPALPSGLSLTPSTGELSGTPTATQAATVHTVTVSDASGSDTATVTIVVTAAASPIAFATGYSAISAVENVAVPSQTPTTTGGAGTKVFSISPALPTGLDIDGATGVISGTPTVIQSATSHTVTVTDDSGSDTTSVSVTVGPKVSFDTGYSTIKAVTGTAIVTQAPSTTGGSGTKAFSVLPSLPGGLTLGGSSGSVSGTPTTPQTATSHVITVTDDSGSDTTSISITVQSPMSISGYSDIDVRRSTDPVISQTPSVSNGYGSKSYSISPALPAGLSFSSTTGAITGTPTANQTPAVSHTVTVTDSEGFTSTETVSIRVRT